jgi:hypothetical protein
MKIRTKRPDNIAFFKQQALPAGYAFPQGALFHVACGGKNAACPRHFPVKSKRAAERRLYIFRAGPKSAKLAR